MKDFTKTESEKSSEKNKSKKTLKRFIPLSLFIIAAGLLGSLFLDFYKSKNFKVNIREEKAYWFQISKLQFPFTKTNFNVFKFDPEKKFYITFYQKKFLGKGYYCKDDKGTNSIVPDGLADKVEIGEKEFIREKDYHGNEDIFHKADQNIANVHYVLRKEFPKYDEIIQAQL